MSADPQLAVEMAVCAHYQIRHSEFLRWDLDDREKAIAHHLLQAEACPGCQTRAEEWDESRGGNRRAYTATIVECPGCVEKERTQETKEVREGRGMHVVLRRNSTRP